MSGPTMAQLASRRAITLAFVTGNVTLDEVCTALGCTPGDFAISRSQDIQAGARFVQRWRAKQQSQERTA